MSRLFFIIDRSKPFIRNFDVESVQRFLIAGYTASTILMTFYTDQMLINQLSCQRMRKLGNKISILRSFMAVAK